MSSRLSRTRPTAAAVTSSSPPKSEVELADAAELGK